MVPITVFERKFWYSEVFFYCSACSWYSCFIYDTCCQTRVVKWAVALISAIRSVTSRWWVNNSAIIRKDLRTNASTGTIT